MYHPAVAQEPVGMDDRTASHVALILVLVACYVAGLPIYGNQVGGDSAFTASLFGLYELAHRYRIRPHALPGSGDPP